MKKLFVLLFCILLIMFLPMTAGAIGEGFDLEKYIGPEAGVWWSFTIAAVVLSLDVILGIFLGIKNREFDPRLLPQFLFTGVLPFIGGLVLLAILAHYIGVPFDGMFYAAAVAIVAKYLADVWEKLKLLFGPKLVE